MKVYEDKIKDKNDQIDELLNEINFLKEEIDTR